LHCAVLMNATAEASTAEVVLSGEKLSIRRINW
jgi:hypothetical protein